MIELDERDRDVLSVLAEGRANPYYIREQTGLNKGDTNTVLNRLARAGHVRQVTRGLYELTDDGAELVRENAEVE
jgi:DNA-binding IclR family transcriptional regulator